MMVCARAAAYKNRKGNPGTRPTAYYYRHRNAWPCDRTDDAGTHVCVSGLSSSLCLSLSLSLSLFHPRTSRYERRLECRMYKSGSGDNKINRRRRDTNL